MDTKKIYIALGLVIMGGLVWLLTDQEETKYFTNQGEVFGTIYNIQYESANDLEDKILYTLSMVDSTLSMFNRQSVISKINHGEDFHTTEMFEQVYSTAVEVSDLSQGAFDITVAPLVNLWGFGTQNRTSVTKQQVDSMREFVGYKLLSLTGHRLSKSDDRTMLDASAIAKGYGCDAVARTLEESGCKNYLVDIGGEIVAKGKNSRKKSWAIGITKPVDDSTCHQQDLQDVIHTENICMATSGNYRRFYYENGEKRSHTIDPRTGYPVQHSLLSATVTAKNCMRADALATACMVLGADDAIQFIDNIRDAACFLIVSDCDSMRVVTSSRWEYTK